MVCQKGHIEAQGQPLCRTEKHDTEERVDEVLWKDKRVQGIALVYRVLVVGLQLIKCYDVPDGEEDERGGEQQRQHIAEGRESERHGRGGAAGRAGASGERRRTALWVKPFTSPGLSLHCRRGLLPARLRRGPPARAPPDGRSLRGSSVVCTVDFVLHSVVYSLDSH